MNYHTYTVNIAPYAPIKITSDRPLTPEQRQEKAERFIRLCQAQEQYRNLMHRVEDLKGQDNA